MFFLVFSGFEQLNAQLTVDNVVNASDGVQNVLLGPGVTASNITFQGSADQIGAFDCNGCGLGIGYGLVMGTGNVSGAAGPNNDPGYAGGPPDPAVLDGVGDADLFELSGMDLNNTAVLEFDFIPTGDSLSFNYVFSSEEYLEWVGSINDAFGFFISGPGISGPFSNNAMSIALIPNTTIPITINNLNDIDNNEYFVDNEGGGANIQADGFTVILTAYAQVQCGQSYHIKLAIGDASDASYDSWVFLEAGSFMSNQLSAAYNAPNIAPANGGMYEGCDPASLVFTRTGSLDLPQTFDLNVTGTAQNGIDFETLPTQVIFDAGVDEVTIPLVAIQDGVLEGMETFTVELLGVVGCGNGASTTVDVAISDLPNLQVVMDDVYINCGEQATLTPQVTGGLGNYHIAWESGSTALSINVSPITATSYNFTVSDTCGVTPVNATANVLFVVNPALTVNIGADISTNCLDQIDISSTVSGGFGPYEYSWTANSGAPFATTPDVSFTDNQDQIINLTVTDACDITASDNLNVTYPPVPVNVNLGADFTATCIDNNVINPVVNGGVGTYSYTWTNGAFNVGSASSLTIQLSQDATIELIVEDECGNTQSDEVEISIPAVPVLLDLGSDYTVTCTDETLITPDVSGGVGAYSYEWTLQSGIIGNGSTLLFQTEQTETVVLSIEDQCGNTAEDDVLFTIPQLALNVDAGSDLETICTDPVTLEGSVSGGVGGYSYQWQVNGTTIGNAATYSGQFNGDTVVELVVTDDCGNENTDQVNISIPPVPVIADAGADLTITCLEMAELNGAASGGIGSFNYSWSDATGALSASASAFVSTPVNNTYVLTIVDECGNTDTDEVNVLVPPVPVELTMSPDVSICLNDVAYLYGVGTGGVGTITYTWTHDQSTSENISVSPESSTSFVLVAEDQCGNSATGETVVMVSQITPNFMAEYVDDFTVAFTNVSDNDVWVEWSFSDGATSNEDNPVHTFTTVDTWEVTLTAWAAEGCSRRITQEYYPTGGLFVPNTFTPDNDGINDVFFCYGHDLASFEIIIFNKWGDVVYQSTDITMPWDGSAKGGDYYVPDGVYPYILKAMDKKDKVIEKKGSVQIIR